MKRTVNSETLDKYIDKNGMADLMSETGLSFYTLDRMRRGKYLSAPNQSTRNALCSATNLKEDDLFPLPGRVRGRAS